MSAQTTLTKDAPMILDATCSFYRNWPLHATLRMDNRAIVGPDIVADAQFLPFRDGVFDQIYCDPPHMVRKDPSSQRCVRTERPTTHRPREDPRRQVAHRA